ncbi:hypothetical protein OG321_35775 [Streptomyces sp. NBC_00424]|uniref:hypothetical protein n=1 Tax=Streptomyces sp. NBC_00424 TaxID=2903648 RepID=UPI00224D246E|nr:hypothetical protein [Streptomyces sp. NBC_00424]MCX5077819.1 hypothetical protein [Streptomyces sp. NBC_00424]
MAHDIVFFLAADDETAAATRLRGPGEAFESVTCRFIEPDSAIAEWDMYYEEPSAEAPPVERLLGWVWPEWVTAPLNDGVEVFALPQRLTRALANASSAELEELAGRWTSRVRSEYLIHIPIFDGRGVLGWGGVRGIRSARRACV